MLELSVGKHRHVIKICITATTTTTMAYKFM